MAKDPKASAPKNDVRPSGDVQPAADETSPIAVVIDEPERQQLTTVEIGETTVRMNQLGQNVDSPIARAGEEPTGAVKAFDASGLDDDALYDVTLWRASSFAKRPLSPGVRHTMKGRVVKAIAKDVADATQQAD